ncbi:hypothetical protein G4234_04975 [Serratia marcescens]|uniref:hypothetical protein n=1 Tax=Serratia marcescens TaxID=615 RepID=UPI00141A64FD|nr:hypothetical protein [Serratia marcescens]NIA33070.1 hypothetical protein [Serratia marcescens]
MLILYALAQGFTGKSDLFSRQESLTRALPGFSFAYDHGVPAKHHHGDIAQSSVHTHRVACNGETDYLPVTPSAFPDRNSSPLTAIAASFGRYIKPAKAG